MGNVFDGFRHEIEDVDGRNIVSGNDKVVSENFLSVRFILKVGFSLRERLGHPLWEPL